MAEVKDWRISIRRESKVAFVGIPNRLGEPIDHRVPTPTLEQIAGDDWSSKLLSQLLPKDRAWGWWTRTPVFAASRLPKSRLPAVVRPAGLPAPAARQLLFRRMTLAVIPPVERYQSAVLEWAGQDTEQIADFLWTAGGPEVEWRADEWIGLCLEGGIRKAPERALEKGAERIIVLYDSFARCALSPEASDEVLRKLRALAAEWQITLVEGAEEQAW